jgi:hypothetical protein
MLNRSLMQDLSKGFAFLAIALTMHDPEIFDCGPAALRKWNDVIELNLPVRDWLVAFLAYLAVAANDFQHHFPRNRAGMDPSSLRLSQWLRYKEDRADMAKYPTSGLGKDPRNALRVVDTAKSRNLLFEVPPTLAVYFASVGESAGGKT